MEKKNKDFSQMKKFTFIRFIEPAEREEIGIGHYGEGQRGEERPHHGEGGPGSPSQTCAGPGRGLSLSSLIGTQLKSDSSMEEERRDRQQREAEATGGEERHRKGEGGGGRLRRITTSTIRDHGVPTTPL